MWKYCEKRLPDSIDFFVAISNFSISILDKFIEKLTFKKKLIDYVINVIKLIKSYYKMKYIANNFLSALIIFGINYLIILSR